MFSINTFAQDYVYKGINDVEAKIVTNQEENGSNETTVAAECYDPANIGKIIQAQGCEGLLIVDNNSLRQMVLNDENYSDTNIFTGQVTDMSFLFCNYNDITVNKYSTCTKKEPIFSISNWNTENVKDMKYLFMHVSTFNQSLNNWNVSNVSDMTGMFYNVSDFNQPLNKWDVSNVKSLESMFSLATSFNQSLNSWNVGNVTNMQYMFFEAKSFNQPLNNWNVINTENMYGIFYNSINFNQPLNSWNVGNVTNMQYMFYNATIFNQDLSNWCVNNISTKPSVFDTNSGFENQTSLQPQWGTCP